MKMHPSDPDIETIVGRIERDELDLQPDFQRGEVWSEIKRQRLIDSILRRWHIPPIHVLGIESSTREEVLDGQQRLATIRDFVRGLIEVDGYVEPHDPQIVALDGFTYQELPQDVQKRFNRFTIRQFTLTDYRPAEPAELFFRLNQLTALTPAEQRNAFVGPAREQVKELTSLLERSGIDKSYVGFSNSRMAYDDVVARLALAASNRSILVKVTANDLAQAYRSGDPFDSQVIARCRGAIELFGASREFVREPIRLNKATLFSWLWFLVECIAWRVPDITPERIGQFFEAFESTRQHRYVRDPHIAFRRGKGREDVLYFLLEMYDDRATSRVGDVFSVVLRDFVLWMYFFLFAGSRWGKRHSFVIDPIQYLLSGSRRNPEVAAQFINELIGGRSWGNIE